jgi:hypothetical protein
MFLQFVRIGGIWGYGGIGRRRTFIALLEWKALMVDRFERKPTRKMNKSYRAGSNPAIPSIIVFTDFIYMLIFFFKVSP